MKPRLPSDPDAAGEGPSPEFARALEEFERGPRASDAERAGTELAVGARVRGTVVSVGAEHALIAYGGRSEGVAETRHFRADDGSLRIAPGDTIELYVVEAGDQVVLAPTMRADPRAALHQLREAHAAGVPVSGRVTGLNAGGLEVDLGGARGFCPLSQVEAGFCAEPSAYVGRTLEFLIVSVGDARGGIVVSRRRLLQRLAEEQAKQRLASLKPGDEIDGAVTRMEPFGAFVDIGGIEGLVHVSEIRHERIGDPRDAVHAGDRVRVRVLRIEAGKDGRPRIGLSIKAAAPDPWIEVERRFPAGSRVQGVVARLAEFGAFVTLAPGVDGLVHVSEAAPERVRHVREVLAPGQRVEAVVLGVDPAKRRISLSIRAASEGGAPPPAEDRAPRAAAAAPAPAEPTTMALALRAAMEKARRKREG